MKVIAETGDETFLKIPQLKLRFFVFLIARYSSVWYNYFEFRVHLKTTDRKCYSALLVHDVDYNGIKSTIF